MFTKSAKTYVGRIETHNVSDIKYIAIHKPGLIMGFSDALILSLDSGSNLYVEMPSIAKIVHRRKLPLRNYQGKIATDGETIVKLAVEENFFSGFDEVWFFHQLPAVPPPKDVHIVSNITLSNAEITSGENNRIKQFLEWQSNTEAVFGLSDGTGLNYFATDETLVKDLEAVYLDCTP